MTSTLEAFLIQLKAISDPNLANTFERDYVWPIIKQNFSYNLEHSYEASFHTVGMSPQPVILSARALQAKQIYLLHTTDSVQHCAYIEQEIEREEGTVKRFEIDRADPSLLYQGVRGVLEQLPPDAALAFDPTSGTNKMVAATALLVGALSQQEREAHLYFVDFKEYDRELRRPKPGSEHLYKFHSPLLDYGILPEI
jgi:hypothetical protein